MAGTRRRDRGQVTIKDIAQKLGVSHATVSRALNDSPLITEPTKARIRAMAAKLGYVPDSAARVMRGEASNIVGFILPDVQNHFYSTVAKVLAETVSSAGLQLVLAISEDDPERELRHVRELHRARARGIVITPVAGLLRETAQLLSELRCVQLVRAHPDVTADLVAAQDGEATRTSTRYLLDLGHRRIAYLGGGPETLSTGVRRIDGYQSAMSDVDGAEILECQTPPHPDNGYRVALDFLRRPRPPTGLVIGSSQLTLGVLRAIREIGLNVPGDVSLVSYDDPDWQELWGPGISTIALPIRRIAHSAAQKICSPETEAPADGGVVIETRPRGSGTYYPVQLIKRGSCRALT